MKCLLAQGANPNHPQFYALHSACRKGHLEIVKALVEAGADTERRDDDGRSPVHWAASYGHKEVLVYLIRDRKCSASKCSIPFTIIIMAIATYACLQKLCVHNTNQFTFH